MTHESVLHHLSSGGPRLSGGILTADWLHLGDELAALEGSRIELVHIDVADGVFAPLFTVGPSVVGAIRTPLLKDVHLMIEEPLDKLDAIVAAGADMITFQIEGVRQPHRCLHLIGRAINANYPDRGVLRGVAVSPSTSLERLEPLTDDLDYILILGIDPGWGGQDLLPGTQRRIDRARRLIESSGRPIALGIDGGVTRDNIGLVASMGADIIVTGSAIFDGGDVAGNIATMLAGVHPGPSSNTAPAATSGTR
jgi:ribulose-phosphate 3-epimerase